MITKRARRFQKDGNMSLITPDESIEAHFGQVATLIGERSRAIMLWNLLDGKAYTATELALCANISKQACSSHLNLLLEAEILKAEKQGRHRYFTFASDRAARVIESIASLMRKDIGMAASQEVLPFGIRYARTCYDHLAGRAGVVLFESIIAQEMITQQADKLTITPRGEQWFNNLSIDINALRTQKRKFVYACMDWSERKPHLGGALAAELLKRFLDLDWIRRKRDSREVLVTPKGKAELTRILFADF